MPPLLSYAMSALYAAIGTLLLWWLRPYLREGYGKVLLSATSKNQIFWARIPKDRLPEHTFSSTKLTIPGQVTTVEYDSSANSPAGKRPVPAVTIMREFNQSTTLRNVAPLDSREPRVTMEDSSDDDSEPEHIQHIQSKSISRTQNVVDRSTPSTQDTESDIVVSYPGGEVRGLEALAELLKHHWKVSPTEEHSSPISTAAASSISQALANNRSEFVAATTSRRSRSQSRASSRNHSPRTRSKSRHRSRNASPALPAISSQTSSPSPSQSEANPDARGIVNNFVRRVVRNTAFFQSTVRVEGLVKAPEVLSSHPELEVGDLFYHKTGGQCQIWIWESDGARQLRWKPVGWGYERQSDHKVLILSEKKAIPSWVQKSHFLKHTQNHPDLQAMLVLSK